MRRRLSLFSIAVIVATTAILIVARPWNQQEPSATTESSATTARADPPSTRPPAENDADTGDSDTRDRDTVASETSVVSAASGVPADARIAKLIRLSDGDSFDIEWLDGTGGFDELRLMGIDAPEFNDCFGRDARDVLANFIDGKDLFVDVVEDEYDRFGRTVANVWIADATGRSQLVNLAMVRSGAAIARSDGGAFANQIRSAQQDAGFDAAGLWQDCVAGGGASDVFILDLHEDADGRDDRNENGEWIEIANVGATPALLTGWQVRDESTFHRFDFPPGFAIEPGESVRIRSGFGTDTADDLYWNESFPIWNNAGDTGYLINPEGLFVDTWTYPN